MEQFSVKVFGKSRPSVPFSLGKTASTQVKQRPASGELL
jgi:hypothetical protein